MEEKGGGEGEGEKGGKGERKEEGRYHPQ